MDSNQLTERDLSFDRNGNILSLKRYGTSVAAPQDNLAYTYEGNKLMQLNGSTYQYDANGNMTHDGRRGLDLSWNHLNLPSSICSDEDALVNYTYLADGTKVITQQPATGEGYAYLGTMTYKRSGNSWVLESVPFTGGRFIANSTGGMDEYRYITDHLGSTRVIVTGTDYHEVEHNDYYPFGKRISDNSLPTVAANRWRFSGKEVQMLGGIGLVDFGARLYDHCMGRWLTQDPIMDKYTRLSPYGYCNNNPILLYDINGAEFTESSKEYIERIKKRIARMVSNRDKRIERIKKKRETEKGPDYKTKRLEKMESEKIQLEKTLSEIATLESSSQLYEITSNERFNTSSEIRSGTEYNGENNSVTIVLGNDSYSMLAHELTHAYQFEIGEMSLHLSASGWTLLYDRTDEEAAYSRGRLFGGGPMDSSLYNGLPVGPISINTQPEIMVNRDNPQALQSIANRANAAFRVNGVTYRPH